MTIPKLIVNGKENTVRALHLSARLDHGCEAKVGVWQHLAGVTAGMPVTLRVADSTFDMVVSQFHLQRGAGGGELDLVDPILAARPFCGEAFSNAGSATGLDVAIASRVPVGNTGNLAGEQFPSIVLHRISLVDVLTEFSARHPRWHFRWRDGKAEIGPLPNDAAVRMEASNGADTERGLAARVHGALPPLGNAVNVFGTEGRLLGLSMRFHETGEPVQEIVVGQPVDLPRAPHGGNMLVPCVVEKVDPLFVRAVLPDGKIAATRAQLHGLRTDQGRCRIAFPLAAGDPLLLAWPTGVFTGEPMAFPLSELPATKRLEMCAESAAMSWKQWDATGQKFDFTVSDEMHVHN
jgi:hypothetical protein